MKKGQTFWAPQFGHQITVTRVSREKLWADIVVLSATHRWRKRQILRDELFPFEAELIS